LREPVTDRRGDRLQPLFNQRLVLTEEITGLCVRHGLGGRDEEGWVGEDEPRSTTAEVTRHCRTPPAGGAAPRPLRTWARPRRTRPRTGRRACRRHPG